MTRVRRTSKPAQRDHMHHLALGRARNRLTCSTLSLTRCQPSKNQKPKPAARFARGQATPPPRRRLVRLQPASVACVESVIGTRIVTPRPIRRDNAAIGRVSQMDLIRRRFAKALNQPEPRPRCDRQRADARRPSLRRRARARGTR